MLYFSVRFDRLIIVRFLDHEGRLVEIIAWGRRWCLPFQTGGVPWIRRRFSSKTQRPEKKKATGNRHRESSPRRWTGHERSETRVDKRGTDAVDQDNRAKIEEKT